MSVHTLFVNNYSLKYSRVDESTIRVSIPGHAENIDDGTKISDSFKDVLKDLGWSDFAIKILEKYVLFPKDGIWHTCLRINPVKGKLLNICDGSKFRPIDKIWIDY